MPPNPSLYSTCLTSAIILFGITRSERLGAGHYLCTRALRVSRILLILESSCTENRDFSTQVNRIAIVPNIPPLTAIDSNPIR